MELFVCAPGLPFIVHEGSKPEVENFIEKRIKYDRSFDEEEYFMICV